jgi:hypothetical protein
MKAHVPRAADSHRLVIPRGHARRSAALSRQIRFATTRASWSQAMLELLYAFLIVLALHLLCAVALYLLAAYELRQGDAPPPQPHRPPADQSVDPGALAR